MFSQNQDKPENYIAYDVDTVLEFFKLFGKAESAKAGEVIFTLGQKSSFSFLQSDKMYLLVAGKVEIQTANGQINRIEAGGLFGEHTPVSARNAMAIAESPCTLMTLSEKQLLTGLKSKPEFVLMLMGVFINSLRKADTAKTVTLPMTANSSKNDCTLSAKMLQELVRKLGDEAIIEVPPQRVIFKEGGTAMLMYVILEGTMSTCVGGKVVKRSGPGEVIGEIALVDQKPRTASVVAETHGSLLAINRQMLLELIQFLPSFGISLLRVLASRSHLRSSAPKQDEWDWD
jgi:CRP-like cAMP-binding protein